MIPRILPLIACCTVFISTGVSAQLLSKNSSANDSVTDFNKRMPPKQTAMASTVRDAEVKGWNLYRYEVLADLAGYTLAAQTSPAMRESISGSIVVKGDQWRVRFYSKGQDGSFKPVADVVFESEDRQSVVTKGGLKTFSDAEIALIKATELVKTKEAPCDSVYKIVAFPSDSGNGISVYRLRDCMEANRLPDGQHIRYDVSADGSSISSQRDFARRCNVLPTQPSTDGRGETINLTHPLDPQPTELHVYLSLRYGVSIYLATTQSNLYWQINRGIVTSD
jgi:hypothetical protein